MFCKSFTLRKSLEHIMYRLALGFMTPQMILNYW